MAKKIEEQMIIEIVSGLSLFIYNFSQYYNKESEFVEIDNKIVKAFIAGYGNCLYNEGYTPEEMESITIKAIDKFYDEMDNLLKIQKDKANKKS